MLFIVNPIGDFPINDDWCFGHPIMELLKNGFLGPQPNNRQAILFAQALWGYLFCFFTGFSFTTLRFSTLILGMAGVFVLYLSAYNLSKNKIASFLAALLLLVNPLYFSLANTFMTDVPFISTAMFSIYFFIKALETGKSKFIILATLFSVLATLIRQFGLIIPLVYAITSAVKQKQTKKQRLIHFIPLLITLGMLNMILEFIKHIGAAPDTSGGLPTIIRFFDDPRYWSMEIVKRIGNILFYFGLLFLPLLLMLKINYSLLFASIKLKIITVIILTGVVIAYILFYREFPIQNIMSISYIGPKNLPGSDFKNMPGVFYSFSASDLIIFYIIGIFGVTLLMLNLLSIILKLKNISSPSFTKQIFIGLCLFAYIALVFSPHNFYDRYLIPTFAFLSLFIIAVPKDFRLITAPLLAVTSIYVIIIILFSAMGTHDYLAWNRARWQAVDYLTKDKKISMHRIDAGYEVNGWFLGFDGRKNDFSKPLYGLVDGNTYMLAFGDRDMELTGYQIIKKFPYQNYIPSQLKYMTALRSDYDIFNESINLLKRGNSDSADIIIKELQDLVQNKPVPRIHNYLGMLYDKKNMFNESEQEFQEEITLNSKLMNEKASVHSDPYLKMVKGEAYFQLGWIFLRQKHYDKSLIATDSAIALNPKNPQAYNNMGVCYLNTGKDTKKAQEFFTKAVELDPNFIQAYFNILVCAQHNNDEGAFIKNAKILISKGIGINDINAQGIKIPDALMKKISS